MTNISNCSCSGSKIELPVISTANFSPAIGELTNNAPRLDQSFVTGSIQTDAGRIPQVAAQLHMADHRGTIKARFGVNRMDYTVDPGLYALGNPSQKSPVLVSANYKMSFDYLRRELHGRNAWILVLDTKGINVWCAAGKGTFGTAELIARIQSSKLKQVVDHRDLILPQLGAPGVAAHQVKKYTGFKVHYGPVRAEDLPRYLDAEMKATPAMRLVKFNLKERTVLIPIEFMAALKPFLFIAAAFFFLSGIGGAAGYWESTIRNGLFAVLALLSAVMAGAVLNPLLLPYLPGRAFATKGFTLGFAVALIVLFLHNNVQTGAGRIEALAWLLIIPAITAYLAMNFTGCSTYTSLSGVKKEMKWALPAEIVTGATGLVVWLASRLIA